MTLGEFREKTKHLPDNTDMMLTQYDDEFKYASVESAEIEPITFVGPGIAKHERAIVDCLVITDQI